MIGLPTDPAVVDALEVCDEFGISPADMLAAVTEFAEAVTEQIRTFWVPAFAEIGAQMAIAADQLATLRPVLRRWNRADAHARRRAGRPRPRNRPGRRRRR